MLRITLFIFICLLFSSCARKEKRYYSGVVVNTAGEPVAQATISIKYRAGASSFSDGYDEVSRIAVSQEDGTFAGTFVIRNKEYTDEFGVVEPEEKRRTLKIRLRGQHRI